MANIAVIGAGPIGGYAAYLLQKAGFNVSIYEEHAAIGKPVQCTGLLTSTIKEIYDPLREFLDNSTQRIEIFSPNGTKVEVNQREYVVDRTKFDSHFVFRAVDEGAQLFYNSRFVGRENGSILLKSWKTNEVKKAQPDSIIGADGPLSEVAKAYNMYGDRQFFYGVQARVQSTFPSDAYQAYFGNSIAPGLFAWIVPENAEIARVGLGTRKSSHQYYQQFIQQHPGWKTIDMQAGPIPVYNPKLQTEHHEKGKSNGHPLSPSIYLVGDAATQVKATTLGGLVPGLMAAECLADAIKNDKSYEKLWKRRIGKELWIHLKLREAMDKFTDDDWDDLIGLVAQEKIRKILEKHDRERPSQILLRAVLKEPRFLRFAKFMF